MIEPKNVYFTVFGEINGEVNMTTQVVESIEKAKLMGYFLEEAYKAEVMVSIGSTHEDSEAVYVTESMLNKQQNSERGNVNG